MNILQSRFKLIFLLFLSFCLFVPLLAQSPTNPATAQTPDEFAYLPLIFRSGSPADPAYVVPADVGVEIGPGVVGPVPTTVVSGGDITLDGTVIENVIVDGCLTIEADNVVIRNVEIRCGGYYPIYAIGSDNLTVEYSRIIGEIQAKLIRFVDATNTRIANNELVGGDDNVFGDGNLDGLVFTRNYRHDPLGDAASHYDGFQLGEFKRTWGTIEISYNYFETIPAGIGVTDLVFATNYAETDIHVIGNYIGDHGWYTLRAYHLTRLTVRNNVYDATVRNAALLDSPGPHLFGCNWYDDGSAVARDDIKGGGTLTFNGC